MKKKRNITLTITIIGVILIIGYIMTFPKWLFPSLYPTYIETVESNWNLSLPIPDSEKTLYDTRGGFHGDGDAITELHYNNPTDIQYINDLSNDWFSGEEFRTKELPNRVQNIIENVDESASYFYLQKESPDYIIFELKGNRLSIYESYL